MNELPYLTATTKGTRISLLVTPGAKKDQIVGVYGKSLKISIKAPPVDGKANKYLIKYLSVILECPKSSISIIKGDTSKQKVILINMALSASVLDKLNLQSSPCAGKSEC